MQRDPGDTTFRRFVGAVLAITHNRVSHGCELHPDLVLQSSHERNPHQGSPAQRTLDRVFEFGSCGLAVPLFTQLLIHPLPSKIMNERSLACGKMSTYHDQILPQRSMRQKLSNQRVPIALGFGKQQYSRRETIDAMHHQSSLPTWFEILQQQR